MPRQYRYFVFKQLNWLLNSLFAEYCGGWKVLAGLWFFACALVCVSGARVILTMPWLLTVFITTHIHDARFYGGMFLKVCRQVMKEFPETGVGTAHAPGAYDLFFEVFFFF